MFSISSSVNSSVFPMYVGVILVVRIVAMTLVGVPHVCGGDPCMGSGSTGVACVSVPHVCGGDP